MSTVYTIMGYGGLVLALLSVVMAAVLFVKWNIPKIIGDITGHSQKKAIERIRKEGYEVSASKKAAIKNANETGRITIRRTDTEEIRRQKKESAATKEEELLTVEQKPVSGREEVTTVLEIAEPEQTTTVLNMTEPEEVTTVLNTQEQEEATTVLNQEVIILPPEIRTEEGTIQQVLELIVTHTNKTIS